MITEFEQYGSDCFATLTETGSRHCQCNIPNQDAVAFAYEHGDYMLAVADGVGSCQYAGVGSISAVEAAKALFRDMQSGNMQKSSGNPAEILLRNWRILLSDYDADESCTTLKCAIKVDDELYLFSIGDGFIAFSSDAEQIISPVELYDFGNETECLSSNTHASDFWISRIRIRDDSPYTVFACTDGIANGLSEGNELNLVQSINKETATQDLLTQLTILLLDISQISSDDKTMGVIKHGKRDEESERYSHNH